MKKLIFAVLCLSMLSGLPANAEPSVSQWRLVKKTWLIPGDSLDIYEYKYDGAGRVSEIRNLSGKTLKNTEKDFVHDSDNRITSSSLYIKGNKLYTYEFTYDSQGRLTSRNDITHDVNYGKPDKVTLARSFRYEDQKIIESQSRSSFGGKLIDETVYAVDRDGNLIRKTSMKANSKVKADVYTYGNFDSRPNPLQFTGAYFFTDIDSRHAGGDGAWDDSEPATSSFVTNKDGLVGKMIVTYTLSGGSKVSHTYEYTYVKLK